MQSHAHARCSMLANYWCLLPRESPSWSLSWRVSATRPLNVVAVVCLMRCAVVATNNRAAGSWQQLWPLWQVLNAQMPSRRCVQRGSGVWKGKSHICFAVATTGYLLVNHCLVACLHCIVCAFCAWQQSVACMFACVPQKRRQPWPAPQRRAEKSTCNCQQAAKVTKTSKQQQQQQQQK